MKLAANLHQRAKGRVRCQVLDKDGHIVREYPWQNNLILNQGLNNVCSGNTWAALTSNCAVGTGVTDTSVASLPGDEGSGAVTTFTGPAPFDFTANSAVGDMIKMTTGASSGTEVRITAVTDADTVEYTPSGTISSGEFIVYRTSQVGLSVEVKRNNAWNDAAGYLDNTYVSNTQIMLRTYEFSAEVGSVTYEEIGISSSGSAGNNLFSRIKLVTGVSLIATQQLRVSYELTITMEPDTLTAKTFNITGWPVAPATDTDGDERWQLRGLATVGASGNSGDFTQSPSPHSPMEPTGSGRIFISPVSTAPAAFGSSSDYSAGSTSKAFSLTSYTALNFFRDKTVTFTVLEAVGTTFRSMGICQIGGATSACFACVFDQAQTKANTHTLTLTFRFTVGRVLA